MNKLILFFTIIFIHLGVLAQQNPVAWKIEYLKDNSSIKYKANIEPDWHLYAANLPNPEEGPLPTEFKYEPSGSFELSGGVLESKPIKSYDKNFGIDVSYFENSAEFTQELKFSSHEPFSIIGNIYYMVCNDKMCIPFEEPFKVLIDP